MKKLLLIVLAMFILTFSGIASASASISANASQRELVPMGLTVVFDRPHRRPPPPPHRHRRPPPPPPDDY